MRSESARMAARQGRVFLLMACLLLATTLACEGSQALRGIEFPRLGSLSTATPEVLPIEYLSGDGSELRVRQAQAGETRFERLSVDQGLSQNSIYCILQDHLGFMWFGTQDGLNKYDGYQFTVYRPVPGDPHSLSRNYILALYEDREGFLWVGTYAGGLNRYDRSTGRFTRFVHDPEDPNSLSSDVVWSIYEDREGTLWVGTAHGLDRLVRGPERFIRYHYDVDYPSSIGRGSVRAIVEDSLGQLWVATEGGGLNRFDRSSGRFRHYLHSPNSPETIASDNVIALYVDREGALWIGMDGGGLDRLNVESGEIRHYRHDPSDPSSLSGNSVQAIYEDRDGLLWVGTNGDGLNLYDPRKDGFIHYRALDQPESLNDDWIWSLHVDRSGSLWVGTLGGGIRKSALASQPFDLYRSEPEKPNSLVGDLVWSIYQDQEGDLWVGTFGGGLNHLDLQSGRWEHYRHDPGDANSLSNNIVRAILGDPRGVLWIGTEGGGLERFDPNSGRFDHFRYQPDDPDSLSGDEVATLYFDRSGALWVGTLNHGLNRLDPESERFTRYGADGSRGAISGNAVRAICEDQQGILWIGTSGWGLNRFDRAAGRFTHYYARPDDPRGLNSNDILSIHEDSSGTLWLGTFGGGLNKFDRQEEVFSAYTEADGLPNDVVYGILEDERGFLWLSTNQGLSRFDPRTETFQNFDVSDGLQASEFNAGAYFQSPSSVMYFGGVSGFNAFYPGQVTLNDYLPPVVLTALTQGGAPVEIQGEAESLESISFRWPNNYFEFEFTALDFTSPEKNQYAYMLENFDKDWVYSGNTRTGRYTNLPGGEYRLRLKGSNNDGMWNEGAAPLIVTVVPPFWATWWFRIGAAIVLAAGLVLGYRLRVRGIQARSRELESQVRERTYEIERRRQVAEGLREILVMLNSNRSIEDSLDYIACQAAQLSGAHQVVIFRYDGAGGVVLMANYETGVRAESLEEVSGIMDWIGERIMDAAPLVCPDRAEFYPESIPAPLEGCRAVLGVPLRLGGRLYGGLALLYPQPCPFTDEDTQLARTFADHAALAIANEGLRQRAESLAVVAERNRLARDLHDSAKQQAFAASAQISAALARLETDPEAAEAHLREAEQLVYDVRQELTDLIQELHPAALQDRRLPAALREYALDWSNQTGVKVQLCIQGEREASLESERALFRIAQGALANVARHSNARNVEVSLDYDEDHIRMSISDDGCGFDPAQRYSGLGLRSMRERAEMIGGTLVVDSAPGEGTRIAVHCRDVTGGKHGTDY